jgi:ADP-heptose:LPS heptosyltransferase
MKVLTFSQKVTVNTMHGAHAVAVTANPGERLLFDDDNAFSIQQNASSNSFVHEVSDLSPMLAEVQRPTQFRKKRVLIYRNRGVGDQLICSALSRFFREVLGADARQLSDRVHEPLWASNRYILNQPLSAPLHLDAVWRKAPARPFFDYALFIESATEWENDAEQPNVYDRLFALAGFDPNRVAAKFKRPVFDITQDDIQKRDAWLFNLVKETRLKMHDYVFVQLRAANKVRSLPIDLCVKALSAVSDACNKKGLYALITDDQALDPQLAELCKPPLFNVSQQIAGVRLYGSLVACANCVVGPDSSALHFAASNETPAVGLWGAFDPDSRCRYYPNQQHLWHRDVCSNAPCFNFATELPYHKCPKGNAQQYCECFDSITADEIYSAILNALV